MINKKVKSVAAAINNYEANYDLIFRRERVMELKVKNFEVLNMSAKLSEIIVSIRKTFPLFELIVTSAYRPGDPGVHGILPLRGVDLRCKELLIGEMIEREVNKQFIYDPARPEKKCCLFLASVVVLCTYISRCIRKRKNLHINNFLAIVKERCL